ncbi:sigma-70 family RNA polymerase sigma factor [Arthrobacter echini]|uniref:Sigma-70 family RNA polymerase sigma factor n=1 Tax=Arthrobacter echini TaxID=1529066 RepID=A0A4S5E012_9MICC|nr:sigma-70 family RNA polymerase sigma factor [Arthrobacter echini]THJ64628.1 sigma-70 family RNA polymerase sigma factor [Arthrobacter echini]
MNANDGAPPAPGPPLRSEQSEEAPDLTALLVATGLRDAQAFQSLYRACSRRVFGLARKILGDPEASAEVTQEVFLMVWEQGHRYEPALGHPISWLMTLTHRRAVDRLRSEHSRAVRDELWGRRHWSEGFDEVAEQVAGREEAERVRASLAVLSAVQYEAISLAYFSHLTYVEVAERLGVPVATAKTRIRDGLKKLRSALEAQLSMT